MKQDGKMSDRQKFTTALLLLLAALVAAAAVTYAWFSIADSTKVNLRMDITTGKFIRISVDEKETYDEYKQSLSFNELVQYTLANTGRNYSNVTMEPVTTTNGRDFTLEHGEKVTANDMLYVEYTLHFRSLDPVLVHLTEVDSREGDTGTDMYSNQSASVGRAMRMSFTMPDGSTYIYNPRSNVDYTKFYEDTVLFEMPVDVDVPIIVRIWVEGNDPECTNAIKNLNFAVKMRFEATDSEFNPLT